MRVFVGMGVVVATASPPPPHAPSMMEAKKKNMVDLKRTGFLQSRNEGIIHAAEIKKPAYHVGFLGTGLAMVASYLTVILIFLGRADSALGSFNVNTPSVIFAST